MARPLLIVQSSPTLRSAFDMAAAARARGVAIQDVSFQRDEPQPPVVDGYFPILVFGSVALLHVWAVQYPEIKPWIWWDGEALDPRTWAAQYGDRFMNWSGKVETVATFITNPDYAEHAWHVRPLLNNKTPPGKLYTQAEITALKYPGDIGLWVSAPAKINDEVRIWFVGGLPVTASQYREGGRLCAKVDTPATKAALQAAIELAALYLPFDHCVMDLTDTPGGGWNIVEFNTLNGAGFYAADPGLVLQAFLDHYGSS